MLSLNFTFNFIIQEKLASSSHQLSVLCWISGHSIGVPLELCPPSKSNRVSEIGTNGIVLYLSIYLFIYLFIVSLFICLFINLCSYLLFNLI